MIRIVSFPAALIVGLMLGGAALAQSEKLSEQEIERARDVAAKRAALDWSEWIALPVLDDGRIKPIDTFAEEKVTLITGRSSWEDPQTEVKYEAHRLLYEWITATDEWAKRPVLQCEFRPLRKLLGTAYVRDEAHQAEGDGETQTFGPLENEELTGTVSGVVFVGIEPVARFEVDKQGEVKLTAAGAAAPPESGTWSAKQRTLTLTWTDVPQDQVTGVFSYEHRRSDVPEKGKHVAVDDVINWNTWQDEGRFEYRSKEIEERFRKIRMAQMQEGRTAKVGDTEEEQELNEKVQELVLHVEAFIVTAGANNLLVVPNLDPRVLTAQTNPDANLRPWISLGALVRASELLRTEESARERLQGGDLPPQLQGLGPAALDERLREYRADALRSLADPDPTLFALLAEDNVDLADSLVLRGTIQKSREVAREMGIELNRSWGEFAAIHGEAEAGGQFPASAYPIENVPQLAQARQHRDRLLPMIEDISPALEKTREAYDDLNANAFASAMRTFTAKIHRLGEALDEARDDMTAPDRGEIVFGEFDAAVWQKYEPLELSERQSEYSAYPEKGATDVELLYNRQRPFAKAWIFFLLATVIVAMSYVSQAFSDSRRPPLIVYGVGIVAAVGALAYSAWGFSLRVMITGWAPVTNMYETVIWVGSVVPLLGLWFALLPVTWPGLRWAWRLTGPPLRLSRNARGSVNGIEPATLRPDERGRFLASLWLPIQLLATGLRCGAAAAIVFALTQSDTSYDILSILPPMGTTASVGSIGIWAIGMALLVLVAWYVPRGIMTLLLGAITLLPELMQENLEVVAEKVLMRRFFLLPALVIATFTMMLSHFVGIFAPEILNPRIGSISAVLRNRFWLYVHVLTIVSSYAAGALAWGLGNVALLYYLFGRYRKEVGVTDDAEPLPGEANDRMFDRIKKAGGAIAPNQVGRTLRQSFRGFGSGDGDLAVRVRPPKETSTLASYTYATIMVATILLGIGTILGGLWADVSWGRFWDWDPKEVWALISFLVYIAVLHGRLAGWLGTFGTSVGSVLCFNAILMSWYGVNFVLPQVHGWLNGTGEATEVGLHSYATGAGGLEYVAGAVGLNLLLVLLASGRYVVETSGDDGGTPPAAREEREVPVEV